MVASIPDDADLRPVGTDQVVRAQEFIKRHPHISITSPRQNGTSEFRASWTEVSGPSHEGVIQHATHYALRFLMDYLEARFDRGTS